MILDVRDKSFGDSVGPPARLLRAHRGTQRVGVAPRAVRLQYSFEHGRKIAHARCVVLEHEVDCAVWQRIPARPRLRGGWRHTLRVSTLFGVSPQKKNAAHVLARRLIHLRCCSSRTRLAGGEGRGRERAKERRIAPPLSKGDGGTRTPLRRQRRGSGLTAYAVYMVFDMSGNSAPCGALPVSDNGRISRMFVNSRIGTA